MSVKLLPHVWVTFVLLTGFVIVSVWVASTPDKESEAEHVRLVEVRVEPFVASEDGRVRLAVGGVMSVVM